MKNIRFILSIFSFILLFGGCSSDDGDGGSNDELAMAAGTYTLVELNINPAVDINNDGNTTSNAVTELPCATGTLELRSDGNWIWNFIEINVTSITGGTFSLTCTTSTTRRSGSWSISNNQVTIYDGARNFIFTKDVDRLTLTEGENLPGFQSLVYER